jgi:hypothetical protein
MVIVPITMTEPGGGITVVSTGGLAITPSTNVSSECFTLTRSAPPCAAFDQGHRSLRDGRTDVQVLVGHGWAAAVVFGAGRRMGSPAREVHRSGVATTGTVTANTISDNLVGITPPPKPPAPLRRASRPLAAHPRQPASPRAIPGNGPLDTPMSQGMVKTVKGRQRQRRSAVSR